MIAAGAICIPGSRHALFRQISRTAVARADFRRTVRMVAIAAESGCAGHPPGVDGELAPISCAVGCGRGTGGTPVEPSYR